jgi:Uma2 family endonuclease
MTQIIDRPTLRTPLRPVVPPLRNGDNLTREEFIRRYEAMPGGVKAELIDGVVYMAPPVSHSFHSNPHYNLIALLGTYSIATPGVIGGDNGSLFLDVNNMPQPDIYLMIAPGSGGSAKISDDGYVVGAPELIIEISNTSADFDLHQKMDVYRRNGVGEYLVWRTFDSALDYFVAEDGTFRQQNPGSDGLFRSNLFPGLWLNGSAILAGNLLTAAADIRRGIESPEHTAFVEDLRGRAGR